MAGGTPANPATLAFLLWFSFFDQHYGDAVDDRVEHLALGTAQVIRLYELHLRVAFRAREDFKQVLGDHPRMVVRLAP
jgi:hypothetical protein